MVRINMTERSQCLMSGSTNLPCTVIEITGQFGLLTTLTILIQSHMHNFDPLSSQFQPIIECQNFTKAETKSKVRTPPASGDDRVIEVDEQTHMKTVTPIQPDTPKKAYTLYVTYTPCDIHIILQ